MTPVPAIRKIAQELFLDLEHRCLVHKGTPLELSCLGFDLVAFLYEHWPARIPGLEIRSRIWQGTNVSEASVYQLKRRVHEQLMRWQITHLIDIEGTHTAYRLVLLREAHVGEEIERVALRELALLRSACSGASRGPITFRGGSAPQPHRNSIGGSKEWTFGEMEIPVCWSLRAFATDVFPIRSFIYLLRVPFDGHARQILALLIGAVGPSKRHGALLIWSLSQIRMAATHGPLWQTTLVGLAASCESIVAETPLSNLQTQDLSNVLYQHRSRTANAAW